MEATAWNGRGSALIACAVVGAIVWLILSDDQAKKRMDASMSGSAQMVDYLVKEELTRSKAGVEWNLSEVNAQLAMFERAKRSNAATAQLEKWAQDYLVKFYTKRLESHEKERPAMDLELGALSNSGASLEVVEQRFQVLTTEWRKDEETLQKARQLSGPDAVRSVYAYLTARKKHFSAQLADLNNRTHSASR